MNEVSSSNIEIKMKDGVCDAFVAHPNKPAPAVLFLMDAYGLREYLFEMVKHLASLGYYVLAPNLFYRTKHSPVIDMKFPISKEDLPQAQKQLMALFNSYDKEKGIEDVAEFIEYISRNENVSGNKIAITGYCMGGSIALKAAAKYPEKIAAVASFHAGRLVSDEPNSVHKLLNQISAAIYVGHADHDQSMPAEQIKIFNEALSKTKVPHEAELYKDAFHGYTMRDLPAGNDQAIAKHWQKLETLLKNNLR